jgi:GDP-L-fucose synthase
MVCDMPILVTGSAGFIGGQLVRRLAGVGARVRATLNQTDPRQPVEGVDYVRADLRELDDCRRVCDGMAAVFMAAANTQGAAVMTRSPLAHVTPNVVMNTHMLAAAHGAGVGKFVFISSGAAYPDTGTRPVTEGEMFDGEPAEVYHAVAWMKRYAEILCETYARRVDPPLPCLVVRPSNVYGPGDNFDPVTSHVTAALVRRVATRETPMYIWGTGEDIRDLIYIDDFLDGLMAAFADRAPYLELNICASEGVSVKDILFTAMAVDGFTDADVRYDPTKPSTAPVRLLDGGRARENFGFVPKVGLEEGLRRTLAWYCETFS